MENENIFSAVDQARDFYKEAKGLTGNDPTAASILTHALVVASFHDSFGHEIFKSIQHGLENTNAALGEIARVLEEK